MADNVGYTPGTGATIAADEISGVLHQRVKVGIGADGVAVDISAANPLPVADSAALLKAAPLAAYAINDLDDASPLYVGKASTSGAWLVQRFAATGEMRYANQSNNAGTATYAAAWAGRASLVYGEIHTLTGV